MVLQTTLGNLKAIWTVVRGWLMSITDEKLGKRQRGAGNEDYKVLARESTVTRRR
jgi:hypothetical protein